MGRVLLFCTCIHVLNTDVVTDRRDWNDNGKGELNCTSANTLPVGFAHVPDCSDRLERLERRRKKVENMVLDWGGLRMDS